MVTRPSLHCTFYSLNCIHGTGKRVGRITVWNDSMVFTLHTHNHNHTHELCSAPFTIRPVDQGGVCRGGDGGTCPGHWTWLSHSVSLAQNTLLMMSHSLIHLPPAHHSHPPSRIHCFIPGSKLTCSTNIFHHSLLAPTWTAFSDYAGPDLPCSTVFHFVIFYFFFILGRAVD